MWLVVSSFNFLANSAAFSTFSYSESGRSNYSSLDIQKLLDIVSTVEPFGMLIWTKVESHFNEWVNETVRPFRDINFLKTKFDRLTNVHKPTGDPKCPPEVRRAKLISQKIMAIAAAVSLGLSNTEDEIQSNEPQNLQDIADHSQKYIGTPINRRIPGTKGKKPLQKEDKHEALPSSVQKLVDNT